MLTNEDLKAIESIIDRRFDRVEERLDRMDERLDRVEERLDLMDESIDRKIGESELRMSQMMDRKLEPIQKEIHMIRVDLLENNIIPRLSNIEQCYLSTFNRLLCNA